MARQNNRKDYTAQSTFTLSRPNGSIVTFEFPTEPNRPGLSRLTLPPKSTWTPDPHWHERYTEYIQCVSGRLLIRLNGVDKVVTPAEGPQVVGKFVVHEFMRADMHGYPDPDGADEDVVVEEWTDPADGVKHVFFRNLLGVLEDSDYWGSWLPIQALLICSKYDNYNVFKGGYGRVAVTHAAYALVETIAWSLGLKPWYEEYTPRDLRAVAKKSD